MEYIYRYDTKQMHGYIVRIYHQGDYFCNKYFSDKRFGNSKHKALKAAVQYCKRQLKLFKEKYGTEKKYRHCYGDMKTISGIKNIWYEEKPRGTPYWIVKNQKTGKRKLFNIEKKGRYQALEEAKKYNREVNDDLILEE